MVLGPACRAAPAGGEVGPVEVLAQGGGPGTRGSLALDRTRAGDKLVAASPPTAVTTFLGE